MAEAVQPVAPAPSGPEQRIENTSAESNTNDGSNGSPKDEDLQHAQILAHARSVSTPPATPAITDEIEKDITSQDVSEHAPGLYVARSWIRPPGLTGQEIDDILQRLNVDLTLACARIRAKSHRKPRNEDTLMIDMRMAGTPARGSTKVTLRPCIWVFCGSKWCQKIVERDVKALNWLGPYEVHFVRRGGPLLSADRTRPVGASDCTPLDNHSPEACLRDDQNQHPRTASSTRDTASIASSYVPSYGSGSSVSGTAASSAPSTRSRCTEVNKFTLGIHQQVPPAQRYRLPCEFHNLTGCDRIFPGDNSQGWMDHVETHLQSKFPAKLGCWFCNDHDFDARQTCGGDLRSNFILRMEHIRDHFVYDSFQPEQIQKDSRFVKHLLDHDLINKRTYDSIVNIAAVPPILSGSHSRHESSHRSHHSRLPQIEEDVDSMPRRRHNTDPHWSDCNRSPYWKNQSRGGSPKRNGRTGDSDDAQSFASPSSDKPSEVLTAQINQISSKGKGKSRATDYVMQSFEGLSLDESDSLAPGTDYCGPSYIDAYGPSYGPTYTGEDYYALTAQSLHPPTASSSAPYGNAGVYSNSHPTTSATSLTGAYEYHGGYTGCDTASVAGSSVPSYGGGGSVSGWNGSIGSGSGPSNSTELCLYVCSKRIKSLIGLECISRTSRGHMELGRSVSKMGGAIVITFEGKTSLYGVTAGHGLIHQLMDVAPHRLSEPYDSVDGSSENSDSESEDEDDASDSRAQDGYSGNRASSDTTIDLKDSSTWVTINHDIRAGFNGFEFCRAPQGEAQPAESHVEDILSGDLALFPINPIHRRGLSNRYTKFEGKSLIVREVTSISEDESEVALPIDILLGPEQAISGTLLPGKFHFSMRGTAIDTRQIRLSEDLPIGSSGSWVVHDQTLYGMIVAVIPGECMALMVPSEKMMSDIRKMCPGATDISISIRNISNRIENQVPAVTEQRYRSGNRAAMSQGKAQGSTTQAILHWFHSSAT